MSQRRSPLDYYLLAAIIGAAVLLLVTLLLPLSFDNDVYESMAWTLYAYHGLPYLASWDMNFPGIVFIHWASIALFGASDFGFRFFDYLVHIAMAGVYYRLLRRWLAPRESLLAALLFVLYYASGEWGLAGQRDTYAAFLLIGATLFFLSLREKPGGVRSVLLGFLCAAAVLIRPTYIFFVLAFLILLWDVPEKGRALTLFVIGCLLPFAIWLTPYLFQQGALAQVYYSIIRFNLDVYSSVDVPRDLLTRGRAPIYAFAIIGLLFSVLKTESRDRKLIILLAACALLSPIAMGKYFTYHFEPFLLIAIAFAALGFSKLIGLLPMRSLRYVTMAAALVLFAYAYYPRHLIRYYFESIHTGRPLQATYERVLSDSLFGLTAQTEVIGYLGNKLIANERVEYVSLFPSLRWRLARPEATRFTTIVPLIAGPRDVPIYLAEWRREFIDSLAHVRPRFIVTSRTQAWWPFVHTTADSALHRVAGFDSLLSANYTMDTVIRGFALYRLRA